MTIKIYIGTADELEAVFNRGVVSATITSGGVTDNNDGTYTLILDDSSVFQDGDSVSINNIKYTDLVKGSGNTVTVTGSSTPSVGGSVTLFNTEVTNYRGAIGGEVVPLTFLSDINTGGQIGNAFGQSLILFDKDGNLEEPEVGKRITIMESVDSSVLFGGVISSVDKTPVAKRTDGTYAYQYFITARGYQWEADFNGVEEPPSFNINAGQYIKNLLKKYTNIPEGSIDVEDSPTIDVIRLAPLKRFSDAARLITSFSPGYEFFISNGRSNGSAYFRKTGQSLAGIRLDSALINKLGPNKLTIRKDLEKTYNIVRLPFYLLKNREPDLFVQSTVADNAFLKTSVVLNGIPANIENTKLLFDDFADGDLDPKFLEDDLINASPPDGFTASDGYLLEGEVNQAKGLHLVDTSVHGSTVRLGDIGRITDATEIEPFTGKENQRIHAKEIIINSLGDGVILGVIDNTTYTATITSGSTTTVINVDDASDFSVDDRVIINNESGYIQSKTSTSITLYSALSSAPNAGDTVTLHRLAKSRIEFGVYLQDVGGTVGNIKILKNGVLSDPSEGPQNYTTETYSFRLWMQAFETTISGNISSTGFDVASAANLATGDVIEIFNKGSRNDPVQRVITVSGNTVSFNEPLIEEPDVGYRIKTLPKIQLQVKGGSFGDITGRDWATIHKEVNTWQTAADTFKDQKGVLLCANIDLVATITQFEMDDPPEITGNIGDRYLFIGTQETDSQEPDIDCIIRRVGLHYQLDFFPDTKALWSSGSTLEVRYKEKFLHEIEEVDVASAKKIAALRGLPIDITNEENIKKSGGRTLDTVDLLDNPLTLSESVTTVSKILDAVNDIQVTVEIDSDTVILPPVFSGETITSNLPGIPSLKVEQVLFTEVPGVMDSTGKSKFKQKIIAGTIDRLPDILLTRKIKNNRRLVIDEGEARKDFSVDSRTLFKKRSTSGKNRVTETYGKTKINNSDRTNIIYNAVTGYTELKNIKLA